jgi:hypothetical protein
MGAHDAGQGIQVSLVSEEDRLLRRLDACLFAGHVSSHHCAMAASSRGRARRLGF